MRLWILGLIVLFFNYASSAELNTTLSLVDAYVSDNFIHNNPLITMELKNNGDGVANIKNVTLNISANYRVKSAPYTIDPGRIGIFSFEIRKMGCSDIDDTYNYNASIRYEINTTTDSFINRSGSFQIKNPLQVNTTQGVVSIQIGKTIDIPLLITNNATKAYYYNITMDPGFYIQVSRYGTIYNIGDLDGVNFTIPHADIATMKFFGTETIEENFNIRFYDVLCSNIYLQKAFFVKTYTQTGGVIDIAVSPDLDIFSIFLLLGVSILFINKTYKTI